MTTVDMEAEYNNRARVPEHPAILKSWQADAEAYRKARENAGLIAAGMPISGLFELEPLVNTSINNAVGMTPETAREASPILWPKPARGVFTATVGGEESPEYRRQSRLQVDTWSGPDLKGSLNVQEGANHFTVINPSSDPQSGLVTALSDLALAASQGDA